MRKDYICKRCNYTTKDNGNYKRHLKSKRHREGVNKFPPKTLRKPSEKCTTAKAIDRKMKSTIGTSFKCHFCDAKYTRTDNLKRHEAKCSHKQLKESKTEVKNKEKIIKQQNKEYKKRLEEKDKALSRYEEELHYFKQILQLSEESGSKNISTFNFINKNYKTAQPLQAITYEKFVASNEIQYTDPNSDKSYNDKLIEDIIYSHRHNILDSYLGNTIVNLYKTKNPNDQSIWSTDQARLKYVIRQCIGDELVRWVADSKGVSTSNILIDPLSSKLKDVLISYKNRYCLTKKNKKYTLDQQRAMIEDELSIMEIRRDIDNKRLHKNLLRYMAPYFSTDTLNIINKST